MASWPQPTRLTNAIIESGLVLVTVALGVFGLPWAVLPVPLVLAVVWWGLRHGPQLRAMLAERPGRFAVLVPVSLALIVAVHGAAFFVASSVHGVF